jgi:predicted RNA-binding protein with PUA-like domain
MKYWLLKSEPDCFSIDDLAKAKQQTTFWDGVRNYQARNFIRDEMKLGDQAYFYHSSCDEPAIMGLCEIVREAYPDHTAFDPKSDHYDPKSKQSDPAWMMVDIRLTKSFAKPLALEQLKAIPALKEMELLRRGSRLSVQPVTKPQFEAIIKLAK